MTPAEFKTKWAKFSGKESAAYQEHFNDLCRILAVPTPIEADPTGSDTFCFQKHVAKDAELFDFDTADYAAATTHERGFADVWKRDAFGWEYKGPDEDLEKAYRQLLRYRESLLSPPLLIVCDFHRYIVRTNFNGAVQKTHTFTNAEIDSPDALRILRAALTDPGQLHPRETTADVTEKLARKIAAIALSLQKREAVELASAKDRREHHVAQKKNLRIARFLNRLVFCFFAEDTGLLASGLFGEICAAGVNDPQHFAESLEDLFGCMAKGGRFGNAKVRHFNGHLFEDATVFELTPGEIAALADAAKSDWQSIRPAIMGTLFERALDDNQRGQLGAHYTSEEDIKALVEPVLMAPLRAEWKELRRALAPAIAKAKGTSAARETLAAFQARLASVTVLDPACGSGNFLYVALQLLLTLEKEVIAAAAALGWTFEPQVSVQQLRAIELNAYAFELAQVSVQIGFLQWRRDNGFGNDRSPVLQNLDGFENKDALLNETFRKKPKDLKAAQAEEHGREDELFKVHTERAWPACHVIVGNPPFLGDKLMRGELGDDYIDQLRRIFGKRIPGQSDLCCYWFEKARQQIEDGKCKRAGLLATQGIRGGANREVLKRIKRTGDIFFAESDRAWILAGANVHISMAGFDDGAEPTRILDGRAVATINANLSASADVTAARRLNANQGVAYIGTTKKAPLDIAEEIALTLLHSPSPNARPNSDVIVPYLNAGGLVRRDPHTWLIDFGANFSEEQAAQYEAPFAKVEENVWPLRQNHREAIQKKFWWRQARPCPEMKAAIADLPRFLVTPTVSKHRVFAWLQNPCNADHQLYVFARADDYFFGVLQSRFHEVWALKLGTRLETRPRYTPTTCFETFPLPYSPGAEVLPDDTNIEAKLKAAKFYASAIMREDPPPYTIAEHCAAISAAARELNELRERWLNPPEWTMPRVLEFPGATDGPWARFIGKVGARGIGTVRYPLTQPRDADCAAKLARRTLTNLYNERPAWLANAHARLDAAVAAAYGFPADLSDDEILARLLELNLARSAAEQSPTATTTKRRSREKSEEEIL